MVRRTQKLLWDYLYPPLRSGVHSCRFWLASALTIRRKNVCFVGITGSAGKTTTKDISAAILGTAGNCFSTPETQNYSHSIARLLLRVGPGHQFAVLELSGGEPGELDNPLRLFTPNIAVLTLVARDHFKAFRSLEAIAEEKGKLIAALPADGVAVMNIDDPRVKAIGDNCNRQVIWVGEAQGATLKLLSARSTWPEPLTLDVQYKGEVYQVKTGFYGKHLALSVLSALGVGLAAGIPLSAAISAVADVRPAQGRMQVVSDGSGITFVRDDWKAPHWSLSAPLEFMAEAHVRRKITIIGTLSDYSLSASKLYPKVARQALEVSDIVIFVGPNAPRAAKARRSRDRQNLYTFNEIKAASEFLNTLLKPGDLVLLKGSNKADHLVRLMYNTQKSVQCWASRCGINNFCGGCPSLYKPTPESTIITPLEGNGSGRKAFIGLGNPESGYEKTPHNAGYIVLDRLAERLKGSWATVTEGSVCEIDIAEESVTLFKPSAQMNLCGPSTRQFLERIGAGIDNCLIVHDEIDLPLGQIKLKSLGSDTGHKGLQSIIAALGSHEIKRLRIGVRGPDTTRAAKYSVLQQLSPADERALEPAVEHAVDLLVRLRKVF
ncbi:MAG: aminoacyl-tRNA hydrolase [Alteromonadaceae bacterium]|nr:aminoacyl-tRNA hydrolase [Alteromonadaceae bacterium]